MFVQCYRCMSSNKIYSLSVFDLCYYNNSVYKLADLSLEITINSLWSDIPANMRCWSSVVLLVTHRLRRWPNSKPTLFIYFNSPGSIIPEMHSNLYAFLIILTTATILGMFLSYTLPNWWYYIGLLADTGQKAVSAYFTSLLALLSSRRGVGVHQRLWRSRQNIIIAFFMQVMVLS